MLGRGKRNLHIKKKKLMEKSEMERSSTYPQDQLPSMNIPRRDSMSPFGRGYSYRYELTT
jgi:hypothetical protein